MRYRDLETGVFLTRDPIGYGDGPNVYCYVHCNPITHFDPLGLNTFLLIWATDDGKIGHVGIATSLYSDGNQRLDLSIYYDYYDGKDSPPSDTGNYVYRDMDPESPVGKCTFNIDVKPDFAYQEMSREDVFGGSAFEKRGAADAIIEFETDYATDIGVQYALDNYEKDKPYYNAVNNNCADYSRVGVEAVTGTTTDGREMIDGKLKASTPNAMYHSVKDLPNAKVVRDPGAKVNNPFLQGAAEGRSDKVHETAQALIDQAAKQQQQQAEEDSQATQP